MENFWDQTYESGDYRNHWDYRHPSQELVTFIASNLIDSKESVMDVGCGAGREAIFLAQCGYQSIGVDLSQAALRIAEQRSEENGVTVDWRQGNVLELPIEKESVQFVNDRGCFHLIPDEDRQKYADEIGRVLKPGGYFLLRGCREVEEEHFHVIDEKAIENYFSKHFTYGPVIPLNMVSDAGDEFKANIAVLKRKS